MASHAAPGLHTVTWYPCRDELDTIRYGEIFEMAEQLQGRGVRDHLAVVNGELWEYKELQDVRVQRTISPVHSYLLTTLLHSSSVRHEELLFDWSCSPLGIASIGRR